VDEVTRNLKGSYLNDEFRYRHKRKPFQDGDVGLDIDYLCVERGRPFLAYEVMWQWEPLTQTELIAYQWLMAKGVECWVIRIMNRGFDQKPDFFGKFLVQRIDSIEGPLWGMKANTTQIAVLKEGMWDLRPLEAAARERFKRGERLACAPPTLSAMA